MKLSLKASLLLTGLVLVVIAATSLFLFDYQQRGLRSMMKEQLDAEAASFALDIVNYIEDGTRDLISVAGNFPKDILRGRNRQALRKYLARQAAYFPRFEGGLFLLDNGGRLVEAFPRHPRFKGQSFAGEEFFVQALNKGRGVGDPDAPVYSSQPVLTLAVPVKDDSDETVGVLCGSIKLSNFAALQSRKVGKTGTMYMVDRSGRFILHPDPTFLLSASGPGKDAFLDQVAQGFEGTGETRGSNGKPMLAASRRIPALGWTVLTQVPLAKALSPLRESLKQLGTFFCIALAVMMPVGFFAMRRIVRPLAALESAAGVISEELGRPEENLGSGSFATAAMASLEKMRSNDEIGILARTFLTLSERLGQTITSLRAAADDWERTFASVQEALIMIDAEGKVVRVNRVAEDKLRILRGAIIGRDWRSSLSLWLPPPPEWPTMDILHESRRYKVVSKLPGVPGEYEFSFSAIDGRGSGPVNGFLIMITDVSERMRSEERIREMAFHDPLTGLPNRMLLTDRLEQGIAMAERNKSSLGVLFLDLDDFKLVNDSFGHDAGDELLRQVAKRVASCLRANDTLSRYAGDEFVCVLTDLRLLSEATGVAERMIQELTEPFDIGGRAAGIGASIGIALYPGDGITPEQLLRNADSAMYRAKGQGKNSIWFSESARPDSGDELIRQ